MRPISKPLYFASSVETGSWGSHGIHKGKELVLQAPLDSTPAEMGNQQPQPLPALFRSDSEHNIQVCKSVESETPDIMEPGSRVDEDVVGLSLTLEDPHEAGESTLGLALRGLQKVPEIYSREFLKVVVIKAPRGNNSDRRAAPDDSLVVTEVQVVANLRLLSQSCLEEEIQHSILSLPGC